MGSKINVLAVRLAIMACALCTTATTVLLEAPAQSGSQPTFGYPEPPGSPRTDLRGSGADARQGEQLEDGGPPGRFRRGPGGRFGRRQGGPSEQDGPDDLNRRRMMRRMGMRGGQGGQFGPGQVEPRGSQFDGGPLGQSGDRWGPQAEYGPRRPGRAAGRPGGQFGQGRGGPSAQDGPEDFNRRRMMRRLRMRGGQGSEFGPGPFKRPGSGTLPDRRGRPGGSYGGSGSGEQEPADGALLPRDVEEDGEGLPGQADRRPPRSSNRVRFDRFASLTGPAA